MKVQLIKFGEIEIDGQHYDHDVVIDQGVIRKRKKKPSKAYREDFGHTPLSGLENIPWHSGKLFIGTGAYGSLPVMPEVYEEAASRGVEVIEKPTREVCDLLSDLKPVDINAVIHITC